MPTPRSFPIVIAARFAAAPIVAGLILWGDHAILTQGPNASSLFFAGALAVFGLAGLTERSGLGRAKAETPPLNAALDGAADKTLIAAALIALCATLLSRNLVMAAGILVARDLMLYGLRLGLLQAGHAPAAPGDRMMTALALAGIGAVLLLQTLLMLGVGIAQGGNPTALLYWFAQAALWAAALLGLWTGIAFARKGLTLAF